MASAKPATKAPRFTVATTGGEFRLADQGGENLVVYFYPRDNTPGCTLEGGDFRDLAAAFRRAGTRILGISTDTLESHREVQGQDEVPVRAAALTRTTRSPRCSASGS